MGCRYDINGCHGLSDSFLRKLLEVVSTSGNRKDLKCVVCCLLSVLCCLSVTVDSHV
jgi:hypothetical protein